MTGDGDWEIHRVRLLPASARGRNGRDGSATGAQGWHFPRRHEQVSKNSKAKNPRMRWHQYHLCPSCWEHSPLNAGFVPEMKRLKEDRGQQHVVDQKAEAERQKLFDALRDPGFRFKPGGAETACNFEWAKSYSSDHRGALVPIESAVDPRIHSGDHECGKSHACDHARLAVDAEFETPPIVRHMDLTGFMDCPDCESRKGRPCVTTGGRPRAAHVSRQWSALFRCD